MSFYFIFLNNWSFICGWILCTFEDLEDVAVTSGQVQSFFIPFKGKHGLDLAMPISAVNTCSPECILVYTHWLSTLHAHPHNNSLTRSFHSWKMQPPKKKKKKRGHEWTRPYSSWKMVTVKKRGSSAAFTFCSQAWICRLKMIFRYSVILFFCCAYICFFCLVL